MYQAGRWIEVQRFVWAEKTPLVPLPPTVSSSNYTNAQCFSLENWARMINVVRGGTWSWLFKAVSEAFSRQSYCFQCSGKSCGFQLSLLGPVRVLTANRGKMTRVRRWRVQILLPTKNCFSEIFSYSGHAWSSCCGKYDHNKFAGEEGVGLVHSILAFHHAAHGFDSRHSQEFFSWCPWDLLMALLR